MLISSRTQGVWRFSQCLRTEAETLVLMSSTPTASTQTIKVKQMEAQTKSSTGGNGTDNKGKGTSLASMPCKYFRSETGRKAGKNCKWSHSWDGIDDKNSRCWICGGKDHRKSDCKLKGQQSKGRRGKMASLLVNLGQVHGEESRLPWLRQPAPRHRRLLHPRSKSWTLALTQETLGSPVRLRWVK